MRLFPLLAFAATTLPALADFSYISTSKAGGTMAAMAGMSSAPTVNHYYFKDQRMKFETAGTTVIIDLDARTITTLNHSAKTYTVRTVDELTKAAGDAPAMKIDVKETGQKKMVNGFMASELVMTMEMDAPAGRAGMGKMQTEMDMWISPDVPGAVELRDYYKRNAEKYPWSAMAASGNASLAKAMADMQREIAKLNGVPVQQVMRVKSPGMATGAPAAPQMTSAQSAQMSQARAQLEAMIAKGGPGADAMKQALSRMPGGAPGAAAAAPSTSGAMIEITMDASDFSSASVPESVFAIPAEYRKVAN